MFPTHTLHSARHIPGGQVGLSNLPSRRRINVITLVFSKPQVTSWASYYPQPSILVKGYLPARIDLPDYGQCYPTALNTLE